MCSNPQCGNVAYERLINPMFATNDKLAEIFNTESTDRPLFCADNVIIRHTAQFVYPTLNHVVHVVLNLRVVQFFVDTAQMP